MTENDIFFFLVLLCVTVIPVSLYFCIVITRDIDNVIKKCDRIGKWAKGELKRRANHEQT